MNPFLIEPPFVVSFSGGRTSGLMLYKILEANEWKMPEQSRVVFCNTGKEREETLRFVERCSLEWGVEITWLEYQWDGRHSFRCVDFASASRSGEPFDTLIDVRNFLPNPVSRYCTQELKIRPMQKFIKQCCGWDRWTIAVGLRTDEPRRVDNLRKRDTLRETHYCPLDESGIELSDVMKFWKQQPFDLGLEQHEGNCDLCMLKGKGKIIRIMQDRPDLAYWWVRHESVQRREPTAGLFRHDRPSYKALLAESKQPTLFDVLECDELSEACHCTD